MKYSKLLVLSLVTFASLGLAGCDDPKTVSSNPGNGMSSVEPVTSSDDSSSNTSSSISNATSSETPVSSSTSSSSSTSVGKPHVVYVEETNHVTVEADKQLASAGENVTLSITPDAGYEITSITVNGSPISGKTFVMPGKSVSIRVIVELVIKGDYMLAGDVSEELVKDPETGLYVARNVKLLSDSKVIYKIKGKELSVLDLNASKSFADVHLPSDNKGGFTLSGGYSYDFFYDPTDKEEPCFVRRTKVETLPSTDTELETLFDGRARGVSTVNPEGVTKVEYTSTERDDNYVWEKYSDNSSLATVTTNSTRPREKGSVYKTIDNNVYTVVDTYVENHDGHCITTTESDDRTKFSARYDVVSSVDYGYSKYQKTSKETAIDVNQYSHTMESLDFDIMYAYRTGFENVISDDEYKYKIDVNSVWAPDGETFTTTVNSYVTVVAASTAYTGGSSYHNEFNVTMKFTKAGALLELEYDEKNYTSTQYDVQHDKFYIGHSADDPKSEKYVTAKYTYGEAKEGKPTFDTSKYFITSLSNAQIVNSKGEEAIVNKLDSIEMYSNQMDYVASATKYVKVDYEPSTALDYWQYGVVSSSNETVIPHKGNNDAVLYPFEFSGGSHGTSTLTIGNHTKSTGVHATVNAEVPEQVGNVKEVFVYSVYPYQNDNWGAAAGTVFAGMVDKVKLCATLSNNSHDQLPENITLTCSNPALVSVSYDETTGYMTVDASKAKNISTATTVTITIGASYEAGRNESVIQVTVQPAPHIVESLVGTWDFIDKDGNVVEESSGYAANIVFNDDGTGVLTADADGNHYVISFEYEFNVSRQSISVSNAKCLKNGEAYGISVSLIFDIDFTKTGNVGCYCLITTSYSYGESNDTVTQGYQLFGEAVEEEESGEVKYKVDDFKFRG